MANEGLLIIVICAKSVRKFCTKKRDGSTEELISLYFLGITLPATAQSRCAETAIKRWSKPRASRGCGQPYQ